MKKLLYIVPILLSFNLALGFAGSNCVDTPVTPAEVINASNTAIKLQDVLKNSHNQVVLIARVGSDASKYNIRYTHMAFANRDLVTGQWKVTHLVNECGTDKSAIMDEGLMNFYLDGLYSMDTLIITPNKSIQEALQQVLNSNIKTKLHKNDYSTISYPYGVKHQSDNQWVLEIITAAQDKAVTSRNKSHNFLRKNNFLPQKVRLGKIDQVKGLFKSYVNFDDHPKDEIYNGEYSIVTVDSIIEYMREQGMLSDILELQ